MFDLQGQTFGVWDPDTYVNGTTSTLLGFIFQNGVDNDTTASVLQVNSGSLIISNCDFNQNRANSNRGAVYIALSGTSNSPPSIVTFNLCSFNNNLGGAVTIRHRPNRLVVFENCIFVNNSAESGGAVFADTSSFVVSGSTFQSNSASNSVGGAVVLQVSDSITPSLFKAVIAESTFTSNVANTQGYKRADFFFLNVLTLSSQWSNCCS